jgi:antimicrobial peptide system SdpA family protein
MAALLVFGFIDLHSSLPANVLTIPFEGRLRLSQVLPQQWQFFTRDPSAERFGIDVLAPQKSPSAWPFQRARRALGLELAFIMAEVPPSAWHSCQPACEPYAHPIHVANRSGARFYCGDAMGWREVPEPWTFIHAGIHPSMAARQTANLIIQC